MALSVVDFVLAALDGPLTPGGDDLHLGSVLHAGQLETDLVVALAGAAVADGIAALGQSDLGQTLGDDGTGEAGAQIVVIVGGAGLHGGDDEVVDKLFLQILNVELAGAGLDGLFLKAVQLGTLSHITADRDNFAVVVVLLQPGDDDGRIQTAGVGECHFLDLTHCMFLQIVF